MIVDALDGTDDNLVESLETELDEISELLNQGRSDDDRKNEVARRIGEVIKKIEALRDQGEWPKAQEELNDAFAQVLQTQKRLGNEKTAQALEQMHAQAEAIMQAEDTKNARLMCEALRSLDYHMVKDDTGFWASYIVSFDQQFDIYEWNDRTTARRLVDTGKKVLATAPSKSKLEEIVRALFDLMPDKSEPIGGVDLSVLRH